MLPKENKPETKLRINRRVWIIHDLLNTPQRQKDLLRLWRRRGQIQYEKIKQLTLNGNGGAVNTPRGFEPASLNDIKMFKPKQFKYGVGITKSSMSKILNGEKNHPGLIEEGIVKRTFINADKGYCLVETYKSLEEILGEFNNSMLSEEFKSELKTVLMNSKYSKRIINMDLIEKLDNELKLDLDENEKSFVFTLLRISPSALSHSLKALHHQGKLKPYSFVENKKRIFLMDLQFHSYGDIADQFRADNFMVFDSAIPVKIKFEIKTSLETENKKLNQISTIQRTSVGLLSEDEKNLQLKQYENLDKLLEPLKKTTKNLSDISNEKIDKYFSLESSPLSYEKNND